MSEVRVTFHDPALPTVSWGVLDAQATARALRDGAFRVDIVETVEQTREVT